MNELQKLINEVEEARSRFIETAKTFTDEASLIKPSESTWCASEIVEHICWAEVSGVVGILKALNLIKQGKKAFEGENPNEGLSIEAIIENTWKPKEIVPPIAAPRFGGPISYWIVCLENQKQPLENLQKQLENIDLDTMMFPHPISGAMNIRQRIQFLKFHLDRHRNQILTLK